MEKMSRLCLRSLRRSLRCGGRMGGQGLTRLLGIQTAQMCRLPWRLLVTNFTGVWWLMTKSNMKTKTLYIPRPFARRHFGNGSNSKAATLHHEANVHRPTMRRCTNNNGELIWCSLVKQGMEDFIIDHGIVVGDVLVLRLVTTSNVFFQVNIYRA